MTMADQDVAPESQGLTRTPEGGSRSTAITLAHKQALIDNFQLEITERARKLRAQYALHAQGLRSRLEMRINRIPQGLRKTNILQLIEQYAEEATDKNRVAASTLAASRPSIIKAYSPATSKAPPSSSSTKVRGTKRSSDEIGSTLHSDKENAHDDLTLPKKRAKVGTATQNRSANMTSTAVRGDVRPVDASKVLSPKSHNSRTLPRSPLKSHPSSSSGRSSPQKSQLARPTSPLKPVTASVASTSSTGRTVKGAPQRANTQTSRPNTASSTASSATTGSVRGKRGVTTDAKTSMPPPPVPAKRAVKARIASDSSNASNASAATTIVKKTKVVAAARKAVGKVASAAGTAAARKAATKKENTAPAPASSGRTLRARR